MKRTKIVATIGPSTESPEVIRELIQKGVNVFRFNFKHNTVEWHGERMQRVNTAAHELSMPVGILLDLQGPEIRIRMKGEYIEVNENDMLLLDQSVLEEGEVKGFSISHPEVISHLSEGQTLLADDGSFTFTVEIQGDKRYLKSHSKGMLKQNKSLNIPGADFPFPVLTERDHEGIQLAQNNEIDYIALSFVRSSEDIRALRDELAKQNLTCQIIAKIETKKAIDALPFIIEAADGVMVARGDLGVELPIEQVPYYQKHIIGLCLEKGIPVITATQMLQSMVENPFPTRAEVSDIANAVYDFTDAVMLSAETATGAYPVRAVEYMARTAVFNENSMLTDVRKLFDFHRVDQEQRIGDAAYNLLVDSGKNNDPVSGIIVFTQTGRTARLLSRYRPNAPIYSFCPSKVVADQLSLSFGVVPFVQDEVYEKTMEVQGGHVRAGIEYLKERKYLETGKKYILLHGDFWAVVGGTSTIKLVMV